MSITQAQHELMLKHLELVIEANKTVNLTRIDNTTSGTLLHIEDSLSALDEINNAPTGMYGDIGTGGGYPGIPIAIATQRQTYLIEARQKKANVLRNIVKQLGIDEQVSVYEGRAELMAQKQKEYFAVITARALAQLSVLMELASPLLIKGGMLVCYKAHIDSNEYNNAKRVQDLTGLNLISDRSFKLSDNTTERRIVCFRKDHQSKAKLPRKEGEAQKRPL